MIWRADDLIPDSVKLNVLDMHQWWLEQMEHEVAEAGRQGYSRAGSITISFVGEDREWGRVEFPIERTP